jgi:hypothetical protein
MLKLYTNKSYLSEPNRKIIFPLMLGLIYKEIKFVKDYYRLVETVEEADILVLPLQVEYFFSNDKNEYQRFLNLSKQFEKPMWVFSGGDIGFTLKDDVFTFRSGGFKSKHNDKTFMLPSFVQDPYKGSMFSNQFHPLSKKPLPEIGFTGHASGNLTKWAKELYSFLKLFMKRKLKLIYIDHQSFYPTSYIRYKLLMILNKDSDIISNFILRKHYRAGATTTDDLNRTTQEYLSNIHDNPYTFCMRGGGNFSVRFYDTLAMGRIPILIDTDCSLPLFGIINWDEHILRIKVSDINQLALKLSKFHNNLTPQQFKDLQVRNRRLWQEYFNMGAYFKAVHNIFLNK